jgi:hypothetical protein
MGSKLKIPHPSISRSRAWLVIFLCTTVSAFPGLLLFFASSTVDGWPSTFGGTAWMYLCLTGVLVLTLYRLLFYMNTNGLAMVLGALLATYSVGVLLNIQYWQGELSRYLPEWRTKLHWFEDILVVTNAGQQFSIVFFGAIGAGIISSCIMSARVAERAHDNNDGAVRSWRP